MKHIFLPILLFCVEFCQAQVDTIPTTINEYPCFFGLRGDEDIDTLKIFERIYLKNELIAFRRFFSDTKIVEEEYFRIQKDTFFYAKYSKYRHEIIEKGKVFSKKCCAFIDTVITFNPETYEEKRTIEKYLKWSKEGFWVENKLNSGDYQDNHRVGEWYVFDDREHKAMYVHYDNEGNIQEIEPYDIIDAKNKDKTLERLQGQWVISPPSSMTKIAFWKSDIFKYGYQHTGGLVFKQDSVELKAYPHHGFPKNHKPFKNVFTISEDNQISLDICWFENKRYKITYLGRYEMEWELVE